MNNDFLDTHILEDYLDGKLDAKAMHYVERLSLEDPFVAEALEGLRQSPMRKQELSLLQKQLQDRVQQQPVKQQRWRIGTHRLSIAATAAILFVTASLVFWMQENNKRKQEALTGKHVEVSLTPLVAKEPVKKEEADKTEVALPPAIDEQLKAKEQLIASNNLDSRKKVASRLADKNFNSAVKAAENDTARFAAADRKMAAMAMAPAPTLFTGSVISLTDGLPIPGADIRDEANHVITTTDRNGGFSVRADSLKGNAALKIGYNGFQTRSVNAAKVSGPIRVVLSPKMEAIGQLSADDLAESDVVIKANKNAGKIVMPVNGWGEFDKYMAKENTLANGKRNGYVELEFVVLKDGTPAKFKVIKSIDVAYDAEAIRLLAEGPKWNIGSSNGKVRYIVRF